MRAIKLSLYGLAGLIASSTLSAAAVEWEAIQAIVYGLVLVWLWTLTNFGHQAAGSILRLGEAELATLRAVAAIVFIVGIFVNWSFEGFPKWIEVLF